MADDKLTRVPVEGEFVSRAGIDADPLYARPAEPVELTQFEMGFLEGLLFDLVQNPNQHEVIARAIHLKLQAASLRLRRKERG
jgi:hypothetical protein